MRKRWGLVRYQDIGFLDPSVVLDVEGAQLWTRLLHERADKAEGIRVPTPGPVGYVSRRWIRLGMSVGMVEAEEIHIGFVHLVRDLEDVVGIHREPDSGRARNVSCSVDSFNPAATTPQDPADLVGRAFTGVRHDLLELRPSQG